MPPVEAAPPAGSLDLVDATTIAGWVRDPDSPATSLTIHIYVDDVLFDSATADLYRSEPALNGRFGFRYRHSPFGAGRHRVAVYALGINAAGVLDGENVQPNGSPVERDFGCTVFADDPPAQEWCQHNNAYWTHRQVDTKPLFNRYIWIGINNSYGGMISQLYGEDRSTNLLQEHGGSAMQLSLWGYESVPATLPARFYRKSPPVNAACDPTPYETLAACQANDNRCDARPQQGRHITGCENVCNGWEVAAPWNPLQAQGARCAWDDRGHGSHAAMNDVASKSAFVDEHGRPGWRIVHDSISNFTKGTTLPGLSFEQKVTLGDVYAKVEYTVRYARDAPFVLGRHPQEIPAIYTGKGLAVFAYRSGQPELDVCVVGTPECCADTADRCRHAGKARHHHAPNSRNLPPEGGWWGVCDKTRTRCLTIATFDGDVIQRDTIERTPDGYTTLTAAADFALAPGIEKTFTIYLFPYKYDKVIEGRSILDRINALRPR